MNLTEKELSVLNELLSLEENVYKKYQMYSCNDFACQVLKEGIALHKANLDRLYSFIK